VSETDYSDYSKAELQAAADEQGVEYDDSDTKAELISKLEDAEAGDDESTETTEDDESAESVPPTQESYPSEQYPERTPIEPDLADLSTDPQEGEFLAPLNAESWVVLDGSHEGVDERWDGKIAAVLSYPTVTEQDPDTGEVKSFLPEGASLTVKEASQGALFHLPLDAFKEIHTNGRAEVLGFA